MDGWTGDRMPHGHAPTGSARARLRTLSLDIETDGWDGQVLSLGCGVEQVIAVRPGDDERQKLDQAFALIRSLDPDVLLGWNVVDFDLRALQARAELLRLPFLIGRSNEPAAS